MSDNNTYAAIDLGSNSFHMVVAKPDGDNIRFVDSLRDSVRLGAGLDSKKRLTPDTEERALETIAKFAERLRDVPTRNIRMVGTNTLRRARDTGRFMSTTRKLIGKPIEIISGREEARIIYSAVAHTLPDTDQKRLVVDIGGGSTEFVVGLGSRPMLLESINIGSVSTTSNHFSKSNGKQKALKRATLAAMLEINPIRKNYADLGWDVAIGCSGTIKATGRILAELGLTDGTITQEGLRNLLKTFSQSSSVSALGLTSISERRAQVIEGGVSVLQGIFRTLNLESMMISEVALREGLIYDMVGKHGHTDTQTETISKLIKRYSIDVEQAKRVQKTANDMFNQAQPVWALDPDTDRALLNWAAQLHEIGMGVAHTQYHKHGAYILENADLLGFSKTQQQALAMMVRFHRRKILLEAFDPLPEKERDTLLKLTSLLRLAALLHRGRHNVDLTDVKLVVKSKRVTVAASNDWLEQHPLTAEELHAETERLLKIDVQLKA